MMHNLALEHVATSSAFEQIVAATHWEEGADVSRLRVATSLGWLVCVDENGGPESLIGFSIEAVERDENAPLLPPRDLREVEARLDHPVKVGLFNTDMTAKGIGSVMANTPRALQPGSVQGASIAVRGVPFSSYDDTYVRKESEAFLSQKQRFVRHGVLLLASTIIDKVTRSTAGAEKAVQYMERSYGQARLVHMLAPPIWQAQQRERGITHEVSPRIMLVRGGEFALLNPMRRVGSYPAAKA